MPRPMSKVINSEAAETLALRALTFLLSEPERLSRFLSLTGIVPETVRAAVTSPEVQAATLEYLLFDESLLLTFCQEAGVDPAMIAPIHDVLAKQAL
jgi:hypothetical protein